MIREALVDLLSRAVVAAASDLGLDPGALPEPELTRPRQREHGDWACNVALALNSKVGKPPRDIAAFVVAHLPPSDLVERVEIAGPGFINIHLADAWLY